ncbi:MAG: hypothetical protein RLZZ258_719 [Actinomycetota bacterium]
MSPRVTRPKSVADLLADSAEWSEAVAAETSASADLSALGRVSRYAALARIFSKIAYKYLGVGIAWLASNVTPVGWFAMALLVLWLPVGGMLNWPEFAFAGVVSLILLVFAVPFLLGGMKSEVTFERPIGDIVAGESASGQVSITNKSSRIDLPSRMDVPMGDGIVDLSIPMMLPGQTFATELPIPTERRGVLQVGPFTNVRTDPVGLFRRELELLESETLYVYPQTAFVPSTKVGILRDLEGNPTTKPVDSDLSFQTIREYVPGDSQRHIHWKSTAKTGEFMVRQFEESSRSQMALILATNSGDYAEADEFELAISALGSIALSAIRDRRELASSVIRGRIDSKRSLLKELCVVNAADAAPKLADICRTTSQKNPDMTLAVIFCGSTIDNRSLQRIQLNLPKGVGVLAVVSNRNAEPSFRSLGTLRVITIAELQDLGGLMARFEK